MSQGWCEYRVHTVPVKVYTCIIYIQVFAICIYTQLVVEASGFVFEVVAILTQTLTIAE